MQSGAVSRKRRRNSVRWDGFQGRGRSDVLDDAPSGGWVAIKLIEAETAQFSTISLFALVMGGFLPMIVALVVTLSVEVPIDRRIEQWTVTTLPR